MNVKEYIASGIIESYVLGLLTEDERKTFEANCIQYPEIAEARDAFEQAMEAHLTTHAHQPPQHLRQLVLDRIATAGLENTAEQSPAQQAPVRSAGIWKWLAAASVLVMAASVYWAVESNRKYKDLRGKNENLQQELKTAYEQKGQQPVDTAPRSEFKMAAIRQGEQVAASIYWDTVSKDVYLMISNMPQPPSDKQYQLWALLPGEGQPPVDLGMIEWRQERLLYRMKNVQEASAFAITLEPKGGSKTPTTTPMVSGQPLSL